MSLLLCSCATEKAGRSGLPATVSMNKDAGRGGVLIVEVRLADGEKLPLVVDTGAPLTAFDKSVEPKLGERLYTATLLNFGVTQEAGVYAAPKLYLGNVALQMDGTNTVTFDRQKLADRDWPLIRGFLGMDVLGGGGGGGVGGGGGGGGEGGGGGGSVRTTPPRISTRQPGIS